MYSVHTVPTFYSTAEIGGKIEVGGNLVATYLLATATYQHAKGKHDLYTVSTYPVPKLAATCLIFCKKGLFPKPSSELKFREH